MKVLVETSDGSAQWIDLPNPRALDITESEVTASSRHFLVNGEEYVRVAQDERGNWIFRNIGR